MPTTTAGEGTGIPLDTALHPNPTASPPTRADEGTSIPLGAVLQVARSEMQDRHFVRCVLLLLLLLLLLLPPPPLPPPPLPPPPLLPHSRCLVATLTLDP